MSRTAQDIIYDARSLLDEYTDDGVIISDADVPDLIESAIRYINMGQKELYQIGRIQKTIELTCKPVTNQLGVEFNLEEFTGEDQYYPDENGIESIKSYYFEADRTHTVYIEEYESGSWSTLSTHTGSAVAMTAYKGNIVPTTTGNAIRIRFSGSTYYTHVNRALYLYQFQSDDDVPNYQPWIQYDLPDDFRMLESVVQEYPEEEYNYSASYKLEQPNKFYYRYDFEGMMRLIYKPIPVTITSKSDIIEVDDIVSNALSFYVASWLAPYQNQSMTNPLFQKFLELKIELEKPEAVSEESIIDVYGNGYGGMYNANIYSC